MPNCISIVGPSASGKSSVGPLLAKRLQYTLYDIDKIISERTGKDTDRIFAEEGTEYFQEKNFEILTELFPKLKQLNSLIVIGASPIQHRYIRNLIKEHSSLVIGLYAKPEILVKRISDSLSQSKHAAHPLLLFKDDFYFSKLLFEFREPFTYFADEVIDTSNLNIQEVCNQLESYLLTFLKNHANHHV